MSVPPVPPPRPDRTSPRVGRIAAGLLLVLFGVGWLLETADVIEFPWKVVLPSALIAVGLALVWAARSGQRQGGLVAIGVILTVMLAIGSALNFPFGGGIGERVYRPQNVDQVRTRYELVIGSLTLDLTGIDTGFPPEIAVIHARVGIGELVVIIPPGLDVTLRGHAGAGEVAFLGDQRSGVDVHRELRSSQAPMAVTLDLSVGLGSVRVRYG